MINRFFRKSGRTAAPAAAGTKPRGSVFGRVLPSTNVALTISAIVIWSAVYITYIR